jgi:hypothetical protein
MNEKELTHFHKMVGGEKLLLLATIVNSPNPYSSHRESSLLSCTIVVVG